MPRIEALPVVVAAVMLAATAVVFAVLWHAAKRSDAARFDRLTEQVSSGFNTRLAATAQTLRMASVAAAARDTMTRSTWTDFVDLADIGEGRGTVGLGYIARVPRADVAAHEAWVRARGLPDYVAQQTGVHDPLYLVTFIEPLATNASALGIDIADGVSRRSAAEAAMQSGEVAMSRRIRVIVGERTTPGFLLFQPVYVRGAPRDTTAARAAALAGWVYAAVRVDALVGPLHEGLTEEIEFSVYEGETVAGGRPLWAARDDPAEAGAARFERTTRVNVFGQPWILVTQSRPGLWDRTAHGLAWLALVSGFALTTMAVQLTARLSGSQRRAAHQAARAEADLAVATETTRRLAMIARNIHNAVVITNRDGGIDWCNEGFTRLTGWRFEEVAGRKPGSFLQGPDSDPATIETMRAAQREQQPFAVEVLNYRRDGSPYWAFSEAQPLFARDGTHQGYMAIQSDITERKRTALQLARQEAQLRFVFESSPVGLSWMQDERSETRLVNPAYLRITGLTAEGARRPDALKEALHPDDRAQVVALDERMEAGAIDRYEIERRFRHGDGTVVWAEYSRRRYTDAGTGHRQDVATLVDITALKARTADLIAAKELAEEANRAKSQFLAMMSHEIRTPMNGVIGMASILMESGLTAEQHEFVRTIANSGGDLLAIINDILDFSKIESGHLEVEREPFDLVGCVEDSIDLLALRAAEKKLELLLELDPALPARIEGDAVRLRQVLVNLLGNAVKFTERGEVRLSVTTRPVSDTRREIRFEVSDTGIGIARPKLPRLFEAFTQEDASTTRRYGGTGLGLPICKRLVELMGGTMRADSEPGRGSVFGFSLRVGIKPGDRLDEQPPNRAMRAELDGRTLLMIDDNASSRRIGVQFARACGLVPTACADVGEALEHLANGQRFDLVWIDHDLAGTPGLQAARQLHRIWREEAPPVALLAPPPQQLGPDSLPFVKRVIRKPLRPCQTAMACVDLLRGDGRAAAAGGACRPAGEARTQRDPEPRPPSSLRLLVVEDNPVNLELISRMLHALGYQADHVADGVAAIERLRTADYEIVLMDVQMPGIDGKEATRRVRAELPAERQPWIIAVTANAMTGDRERCLAAGMNDYASKPLKLADVARVMERAREAVTGAVRRP